MFDVNDRELQGALTHYPSLVKSLISTEKERMTMTSVRPSTNPKNVQVGVIPTYLYNIGSSLLGYDSYHWHSHFPSLLSLSNGSFTPMIGLIIMISASYCH